MDAKVTKYFDFYGITDDEEFVSRFFKCREAMDHTWGERRGFRPEDVDHVTDILVKRLSGLCETFDLDKDLVLAGVDKAIELYREEDEKAPEGFREQDRCNDLTGERWRIVNLAYNAAFGFYLAKRLGRRCLLEEACQAPCRIHERRIVSRRKQHNLAAESLAQVRTHLVILCIVQFFICYSALRVYATTTLLGLSTESPLPIIFYPSPPLAF